MKIIFNICAIKYNFFELKVNKIIMAYHLHSHLLLKENACIKITNQKSAHRISEGNEKKNTENEFSNRVGK